MCLGLGKDHGLGFGLRLDRSIPFFSFCFCFLCVCKTVDHSQFSCGYSIKVLANNRRWIVPVTYNSFL